MPAHSFRTFACITLLCLGLGNGSSAAADRGSAAAGPKAATITVTGERSGPDMERSVASIGDVPHHEIMQRVYTYALSSPDAKDFNGATATNFAHADTIDGSGSHTGYVVWKLRNGDTVSGRFTGTHSALTAGAVEAPYSGDFEFTSGTGKYGAIKGHGKYEGVTTPDGSRWKATLAIQY